ANLLKMVRAAFPVHTQTDENHHWMIAVIGEATIVWARRSRGSWTDEEQWAWLLASEARVRWHARAAPALPCLAEAARDARRLTHDFSNSLTGIMGFTELSLAHAPAESMLHRYLTEVLQAARDGAAWVRRLHLFCRRAPSRCWPTVLSGAL